jgi:hypothetical protein
MCGAILIHGWQKRIYVLLVTFFFIPPGVTAGSITNFMPVNLPRGIELQVPRGWWLLGPDYTRLIDTTVEAAMDVSAHKLVRRKENQLSCGNSMPTSTYAALHIDSPCELSSITEVQPDTHARQIVQ